MWEWMLLWYHWCFDHKTNLRYYGLYKNNKNNNKIPTLFYRSTQNILQLFIIMLKLNYKYL